MRTMPLIPVLTPLLAALLVMTVQATPAELASLHYSSQASLATAKRTKQAFAERDCAPWDGPAFAVWISGEGVGGKPDSWIYLRIWRRPENSLGRFTFPDKSMRQGVVAYIPELKSPQVINWSKQPSQAVEGSVRLIRVDRDQTILGELDLRSESNIHLRGIFEARWKPKLMACG